MSTILDSTQLFSDMATVAKLSRAIYAASGERHQVAVIGSGESHHAVCGCQWTGDVVESMADAFTAVFVEHLEPLASRFGVELDLS